MKGVSELTLNKENSAKARKAVLDLLESFGVDIDKRPDMRDTPQRVVKMLSEVWAGEAYTNDEIAEMYGKVFPCSSDGMIVVKDINCFSFCEHHLALMYDMNISVGYLPNGHVIGLSKIARIADMCCRRLQLQERIGSDIADVLTRIVGDDVIVRVEACHSCVTMRGISKHQAKTVTLECRGQFRSHEMSNEFLRAVER